MLICCERWFTNEPNRNETSEKYNKWYPNVNKWQRLCFNWEYEYIYWESLELELELSVDITSTSSWFASLWFLLKNRDIFFVKISNNISHIVLEPSKCSKVSSKLIKTYRVSSGTLAAFELLPIVMCNSPDCIQANWFCDAIGISVEWRKSLAFIEWVSLWFLLNQLQLTANRWFWKFTGGCILTLRTVTIYIR